VDKARRGLASKDGPQAPGDGNASREIAFGGAKGVGSRGTFEEEEGEENKELGPNASLVSAGIDTKGLKGGEDNEESGPTMVQREWEMNKEFVGK